MGVWTLILLAVAFVLLVAAIGIGVKNYRWLATAKMYEGTVVELVESYDNDGDLTYRPRIQYLVNEHSLEYLGTVGSNPPSHKVGDPLMMAYSDAYEKGGIASFGYLYGFSLIGGMIAIVMMISIYAFHRGPEIMKALHPHLS